jgi:hypothetical protein
MRKAQSTLETMMAIGVILAFVLLLYNFVLYPRIQESNYAQTYYLARSTCTDLSNAINTVAYNGNGFSERVLLPQRLYGTPYTVTVRETLVQLAWDKGNVYCQYRAKNVSYNSNLPPFALTLTSHVLNNSQGVVKIV